MNILNNEVPDSALTESKDSNKEIDTPTLQDNYIMNPKPIVNSVFNESAHRAELKEFVQLIRPTGGLIAISGINPQRGGLVGRTFDVEAEIDNCIDYIIEREKLKWNVHFAVNEPNRKVSGKLKKTDIKEVSWVHVDIDPDASNYTVSRNELLKSVEKYVNDYKPDLVLDSGHGIQVFWKHETPLSISDGEKINRDMIRRLNGDKSTWNADRLMRIPFTLNYPTATKIAKGYPAEPCMSYILYQEADNV